ncbi:MAG TPA: PAS domain S-box protein, partial [Dehalococcoidales bacterium]|nr:PAS domain S-box protein [Dehalococcoidales bacterium]
MQKKVPGKMGFYTKNMASQPEFKTLTWLAALPLPAIILDGNNVILDVNRAFTRLTGFSKKEVTGQTPPYPFFPLEKQRQFQSDLLRRTLRGKRFLCKKNGTLFWAEVNLKPLGREVDSSFRLVTFQDVTKLRDAHNKSRGVGVQNQQLLDAIPVPISINSTDGTVIKQVNRSFLDNGGFSRKEIVGCRTSDLPWNNQRQGHEVPAFLPVAGKPNEFEIHLKTKSGEPRVSLLKSSRARIGEEEFTVAASVDITDRKQAEEALRVSEQRYLDTFENILEGCHILDFNWRFVFINPAAARQARKSIQLTLGKTAMEVFPGIENTPAFSAMLECMEKRVSRQVENFLTYEDGTSCWFELSIHPVKEGIFILSVDMNKRKLAELNARRLMLQQQSILDNIPDMAWLKDRDLRFTAVNKALLDYGTMTAEQLIGKTDKDIFPELFSAKFHKDDEYVIQQVKSVTVEEQLPDREGGYIWFETSKTPLLD